MATVALPAERARSAPCDDRTRCGRRLAAFVLVLLSAFGARGAADAGDPALAKFLLDAGRKSIEKKQYDDALSKLEKAATEDPALLEALYWIGVAHDKKGDVGKAVTALRAFREGCAAASAGAALDKELAKLLKATEGRLAVLAAAEVELLKLHEAFIAKSLAFAKANFLRDPLMATKAVRLVLILAPAHEEARRLLEKLGGAPPPPPENVDRGPYNDVKTWTDLLATQFLKGTSLAYERDMIVLDDQGGHMFMPKVPFESTKAYVYELEFQLMKAHADSWYLGLVFGQTPGAGHLVAMMGAIDILLVKQEPDGAKVELFNKAIPPVQREEWRRLMVSVSGRRVEIFLDDKVILNEEIKGRDDLAGSIGLTHQRHGCEIRRWRFGVRE